MRKGKEFVSAHGLQILIEINILLKNSESAGI